MKWLAVAAVVLLAGCSAPSDEPFVHPFTDVVVDGSTNLTVLWPEGGKPPASDVDWRVKHFGNDALGWLEIDAQSVVEGVTIQPAGEGPRYGVDGFVGVEVTLFAFNKQSELLAATMNQSAALERVPWGGNGYQEIPSATYFFGEGPSPNGMAKLPGVIRELAPVVDNILQGQPEGAVVSLFWPEESWESSYMRSFVGNLHVTAQIDRLVQA